MTSRPLVRAEFDELVSRGLVEENMLGSSLEQTVLDLHIFNVLKVNPDFIHIREPGKAHVLSKKGEIVFPVQELLSVARIFSKLKDCKNFESFSKSFKNVEQFTCDSSNSCLSRNRH